MRIVSAQRGDDIQVKIKAKFGEFNRTSSPSKGRKYPKELQTLACQASAEGVTLSTLCELTGASSTALTRWCQAVKAPSPRRQLPPPKARRLEVVGSDVDKRHQPIVVRLPSGVSIEFGDGAVLSGDFLVTLATLGGNHHAASR